MAGFPSLNLREVSPVREISCFDELVKSFMEPSNSEVLLLLIFYIPHLRELIFGKNANSWWFFPFVNMFLKLF